MDQRGNNYASLFCRNLSLVDVGPGTGLSSPISARTLGLEGGPEEQARLLKLFRADNIGEQGLVARLFVIVIHDDFSDRLRGDQGSLNACISSREKAMDHYGPKLWWILLRQLSIQIVSSFKDTGIWIC